ncbi:hypothetical protein FLK61_22685 [Paenalkalicoccus suaedae]|uniref:Uncharacterized protein n=1 Tax=Paenalkalicoccus suaedae TaxID=2592382 RepID=A0A859F991_9BACI|nr:hypothetical protein FLK61_22685 [Paenalkalicoccus suaedae]
MVAKCDANAFLSDAYTPSFDANQIASTHTADQVTHSLADLMQATSNLTYTRLHVAQTNDATQN